jgi:hypothetical protein
MPSSFPLEMGMGQDAQGVASERLGKVHHLYDIAFQRLDAPVLQKRTHGA